MKLIRKLTAVLLALVMAAAVFVELPRAAVIAEGLRSAYGADYFAVGGDSSISNLMRGASGSAQAPVSDHRTEGPAVLRGGRIRITNIKQLFAIGTGAAVTDADLDESTFGAGEPVCYEDGSAAVYSNEASYYIENDIPLEGGTFLLASDFTGSIKGSPRPASASVYDEATDTIFLANVYQLAAAAAQDCAELPVVTGDILPDSFGVGQLIFPESLGGNALTYSPEHNYVIAAFFTTESGASPALTGQDRTTSDPTHRDGRDWFGQTSVEIGGTTYILIGDRQQLDAINSDAAIRTNVC